MNTAKEILHTGCYAFHIMIHPFDGFWELKYHKKHTFAAANCILFLVCLMQVLIEQFSGYIFNWTEPEDINLLSTIATYVLPVAAWTIMNWALSTLFNGKATMKQLWVQTCFSLFPLIILLIPWLILSLFLTSDEGAIMNVLNQCAWYWTIILLIFGNLTIQDYTMGKTLAMGIFTILGIAAAIFIGIIIFSTFQQLVSFLSTVALELKFNS
ncbi:MAG TPA: hypothetical protein H9671_06210 [Firmicutes bacterium]|nr:hypothetical protein [Bacillota bacterium]